MGRDLRSDKKRTIPESANANEEQVKKYSAMNESELMNSLMLNAQQGRANGTLSDKDLDAMYNQVAPMLNPVQRNKMKSLINMLKGTP